MPNPPADPEINEAQSSESEGKFAEAARLFLLAAEKLENSGDANQGDCLMRVASCLERAQDWRALIALWEKLGDRLGQGLDGEDRFTSGGFGHHGRYGVVEYQDWKEGMFGTLTVAPGYFEPGSPELARHQQANAYSWAAEAALTSRRFERASRLYRKAALTWELSFAGEIEHGDPGHRVTDAEHWLEAARCYFRAGYWDAEPWLFSSVPDPLRAYTAKKYGWKSVGFKGPRSPSHDTRPLCPCLRRATKEAAEENQENDVVRMRRCFESYRARRTKMLGRYKKAVGQDEWKAFHEGWEKRYLNSLQEEARLLGILQNQLARGGWKHEAVDLYRESRKVKLATARREGKWAAWVFDWIWRLATGSNSSLVRTLGATGLLYLGVFPVLFLLFHAVQGSMNDEGLTRRYADCLIFTLGTVTSLGPWSFQVVGSLGMVLQCICGLSAYFVLGYTIWLALRSFE